MVFEKYFRIETLFLLACVTLVPNHLGHPANVEPVDLVFADRNVVVALNVCSRRSS